MLAQPLHEGLGRFGPSTQRTQLHRHRCEKIARHARAAPAQDPVAYDARAEFLPNTPRHVQRRVKYL